MVIVAVFSPHLIKHEPLCRLCSTLRTNLFSRLDLNPKKSCVLSPDLCLIFAAIWGFLFICIHRLLSYCQRRLRCIKSVVKNIQQRHHHPIIVQIETVLSVATSPLGIPHLIMCSCAVPRLSCLIVPQWWNLFFPPRFIIKFVFFLLCPLTKFQTFISKLCTNFYLNRSAIHCHLFLVLFCLLWCIFKKKKKKKTQLEPLFCFIFQLLEGSFTSQVSHEVDGLIFQPCGVRLHPHMTVSPLSTPRSWLPGTNFSFTNLLRKSQSGCHRRPLFVIVYISPVCFYHKGCRASAWIGSKSGRETAKQNKNWVKWKWLSAG